MKQQIMNQLGVISFLILSSCGQNSHMTLDAVTAATDITAPTASLSGAVSGATNTALQTITVTFSEAVVAGSIIPGDFNITNGVLSNLSCISALAPTSCTFDVTASGQGAVSVQMPASAVQDGAGNNNAVSNVIAWSFDSVGPTVSLAIDVGEPASGSSTNDSSIALTLTASEALAALVAGDFTCTNCTVSGISGSGTAWTLNVIPSGLGAVSVELAASAVQDGAGNSNVAASNNLNWTYNNVAPAFTLAPASGAPASGSTTNTSPVAVELSSSAAVTGLVAGDIVCTGCTINSFSGSGASYSFNVVPSGQGAFSVNVPASVAQDAATNQNTASNTLSWSYDTSAPSATLAVGSGGAASGSTTNAASIPITVSMGESVTGLVGGDFTCTNCTLSGFSGSGSSYSFNVVPTTSGAVSVQLPAGRAADAAGNGNTISNALSWTYDNTAPTVVLSGAPVSGYANSAQTITATFSEIMNLSTLSSGDVSVINGSVSAFSCSGNPTSCTFTVTATANGTVSVAMAASVAQDNAGNNNTAATNISWTHDTTAPTVVISSTASSPVLISPIPIDLTWNELINISSLSESDFTIGNGSVDSGSLSCTNLPLITPTYTKCSFAVTPAADGAVTVDLATSSATDLAANGNTTTSQFSITYTAGTPADTAGYDSCLSVAVDSAGNVYCAGYTDSSLAETIGGSYDFFVVKFDSSGNLVWIKQAGATGGYTQNQIATQTGANGGGFTNSYDLCYGVAVDSIGNVYCAGYTGSALAETNATDDFFVVKLDVNGDLLWIRQAGATGGYTQNQFATLTGNGDSTNGDYFTSIAIDSHDNVLCGGYTGSGLAETWNGSLDILVAKFDSDGNLIWARQASQTGGYTQSQIESFAASNGGGDTSGAETVYDIAIGASDSLYIAGSTTGSLAEVNGGASDFYVAKFSSDGDLIWIRQAGRDKPPSGTPPCGDNDFDGFDDCDPNGEYSPGSPSYTHTQLSNFASSNGGGNANGYDYCTSIAIDNSNDVYCTGYTDGNLAEQWAGSGGDFFVVKFDASGDLVWIRQAGNLGGYTQSQIETFAAGNGGGDYLGSEFATGIAVDVTKNVYISGRAFGSIGESHGGGGDLLLMKFDSNGDLLWIRQAGASGDYTQSQVLTLSSSNGGGDTSGSDECNAVALDSSGNIYCAGAASGSLAETRGGNMDFLLMKFDNSGDLAWIRQAGTSGGYTRDQIPPHLP